MLKVALRLLNNPGYKRELGCVALLIAEVGPLCSQNLPSQPAL